MIELLVAIVLLAILFGGFVPAVPYRSGPPLVSLVVFLLVVLLIAYLMGVRI